MGSGDTSRGNNWSIGLSMQHVGWGGGPVTMTARRIALFLAGLVLGYVLSGFVLGPSVLAVIAGILLGMIAAFIWGS